METDNKAPVRTIKKKFIIADKTGRGVKGVGGYVGSFFGGAILALGSKNGTDSETQEAEEEE